MVGSKGGVVGSRGWESRNEVVGDKGVVGGQGVGVVG